ncbi:hypothetical protein BDU57DRAFT_577891 [Ampelomyces quisqualis]|uniref:Uncharacterized protein n=1 Tax=Ampelomyces quisqualis TaxID=50730 RepID=A0A6A5QI70_AMPQU|nr:hypothetical protein BDU57DRAFT_577891 [Ampelomyces quisqualis]
MRPGSALSRGGTWPQAERSAGRGSCGSSQHISASRPHPQLSAAGHPSPCAVCWPEQTGDRPPRGPQLPALSGSTRPCPALARHTDSPHHRADAMMDERRPRPASRCACCRPPADCLPHQRSTAALSFPPPCSRPRLHLFAPAADFPPTHAGAARPTDAVNKATRSAHGGMHPGILPWTSYSTFTRPRRMAPWLGSAVALQTTHPASLSQSPESHAATHRVHSTPSTDAGGTLDASLCFYVAALCKRCKVPRGHLQAPSALHALVGNN